MMSSSPAPRHGAVSPAPLRAAIAIPARNEEQHVVACLDALAEATRRAAGVVDCVGVVLLLNNCTDATAARARACAPPFPLIIEEIELPPARAHAGVARGLACDRAAALLDEAGVLLVTDADSRVTSDWLLAHARAFRQGVDVVAGHVRIDQADMALWPRDLRRRELREAHFGELLCELAARIDPDPRHPWPHHDQASGASLGATIDAYRRIGGIPAQAVGEDRAFIAAAKRLGRHVRHDVGVRVVTSGRMEGRAVGGKADTITYRGADAGAACDERLEPVQDAVRRFTWRRDMRRLHARRHLGAGRFAAWSERLALSGADIARCAERAAFTAFWQELEERSPALARAPLHPRHLPAEIAGARAVLRGLTASAATRPHDSRVAAPSASLARIG